MNCCASCCLKNVTYNDAEETREKYRSLQNTVKERNYILEYLKEHTRSRKNKSGEMDEETYFHVKGKTVCKKAWLCINNINFRRFSAIANDFKNGSEFYQHGNKGSVKRSVKTSDCCAWISFFVKSFGDKQPDSDKIHLPSCFTKLNLYKKMCSELEKEVLVSQSQFYGIMERQFSHVIIPKV